MRPERFLNSLMYQGDIAKPNVVRGTVNLVNFKNYNNDRFKRFKNWQLHKFTVPRTTLGFAISP